MVRGLLPKNPQKAMTKLFKNYPPQGQIGQAGNGPIQ